MRIYLTGHEGFIGTEMKKSFKEHELVLCDQDIRTFSPPENIDMIFHLAAMVSAPLSVNEPELYYDVNVNGSRNIFKWANSNNIPIVIFSSSSVVEWWTNPYGTTKKMMEEIAPDNSIIVRPFNVFPGRSDMLIKKLQNNEVQILNANHARDWTPVEEVVEACENLVYRYDEFKGMTIDFGTGKPISNMYWANLYNYSGEYNYDPTPTEREVTKADPTIMSQILGREVKTVA